MSKTMTLILSRDQIRQVDQLAISEFHMSGLVLMENAGRNAARIMRTQFGDCGNAFICCGPGNNGGDGCVIARHLHNCGWGVRLLVIGAPERMTDDMRANFHIVTAMGLEPVVATEWSAQEVVLDTIQPGDVVVDALLGTGFAGDVRSPAAEVIRAICAADKHAVVAIDVPSGLDCQTGLPGNATIEADLTITFVAKKTGFNSAEAAPFLGEVHVADIGAPRALIQRVASG